MINIQQASLQMKNCPKAKMNKLLGVFILVLLQSCSLLLAPNYNTVSAQIPPDTIALYDSSRSREIPIASYKSKSKFHSLVVISHGYNQNEGTPYLGYSFIANDLTKKGYYVVSIQHELRSDSLLPNHGVPQLVRHPFWERGADNIYFVIQEMKKRFSQLDDQHIILIGHSMGGDMAALFPQKYPSVVSKIITLDNRRMALPRTNNPKIYSLRSCDQVADTGVLPSEEEQHTFDITVIKLPETQHNNMCDNANNKQQKEMLKYINAFLND